MLPKDLFDDKLQSNNLLINEFMLMAKSSVSNNVEMYESLFELSALLGNQSDFSEILRFISSRAAAMFNAEVASIVLINPKTQDTLKTVIKEVNTIDEEQYQLVQTNIIGWSMKNKQSFIGNDLNEDSRFRAGLFKDLSIESAMCAPLKYRGNIFGYIFVINNKTTRKYSHDSLQLLETLCDISSPHINSVQKIQEYFSILLSDESILYKYAQLGLLGKSETFLNLLKSVEAAARCDVRVVLEGQTGTGKELVARAIHKLSIRSEHPFIAIDCGAIPKNLMESELFGHVKGAYTGANRDRKGLITEAHNGTLFLDEINNLSMEMQSKLLRVLQEGEVRPVGSNRKIKINVRVICASSMSLSRQVEEKNFREDLYFRLMVYPIYIPTLDERKRDIPILANYFLCKYSKKQNKRVDVFSKEILEYLKCKHWAGNVRELENIAERLVTQAPQSVEVLGVSELTSDLKIAIEEFIASQRSVRSIPLNENLRDYEKKIIVQALEDNDWNQNETARKLNLLEQTLRAKMKKLGISRNR